LEKRCGRLLKKNMNHEPHESHEREAARDQGKGDCSVKEATFATGSWEKIVYFVIFVVQFGAP
jgi:hypothetical protein